MFIISRIKLQKNEGECIFDYPLYLGHLLQRVRKTGGVCWMIVIIEWEVYGEMVFLIARRQRANRE